jgi:hypothetical protein
MKAFHETQSSNVAEKEPVEVPAAPTRRAIPAPGRPLSFEEAKKLTFKKYDNALRELAK